ncbi:MAG: hypothetical protein KY468_01080 [Armatimonadetes bacterium]|nr:hypothetical protein [Armatimonadota bacterium]
MLTLFVVTVMLGGSAVTFAQDDADVIPPVRVETPPVEEPPRPPRQRFRIGPEVGVYFPTSSEVRDLFGGSWVTFGLGFGGVGGADPGGRLEPDITFIYKNSADGHIFMAPLGVGYRKALNRNPESSSTPYAGASANLILADVQSQINNVDTNLKAVAGGSVFAGVSFRDRAYVEARYRMTGRVGGFNLSGMQVSAGFRF